MSLGLNASEIKNLSQSNRYTLTEVELLLQKLKKVKSIKRRQPIHECLTNKEYEKYLENLMKYATENLTAISDLCSDEHARVLNSMKIFRQQLAIIKTAPVNELINLNLLPKIVDCLLSPEPELQYETAWVLTNMAVGSTVQTRFMVEAGAVPNLVGLLWSESSRVRIQAVWALGNVAGDEEFRGYVCEKGALTGVIHATQSTQAPATLKCTWALENLCVGEADPEKLLSVLPVLEGLLTSGSEEVVSSAMRILTYLSFREHLMKHILHSAIIQRVFFFLSKPVAMREEMLYMSLQVVANVTKPDGDLWKNSILEKDLLPSLLEHVKSKDPKVIRLICHLVANLSNGNPSIIQTLLKCKLLPLLYHRTKEVEDEIVQSLLVRIIFNIIVKGTHTQKLYLIERGTIRELFLLLRADNDKVFFDILCCVEKLLTFGESVCSENYKVNVVAKEIVEVGGLEDLERLLSHESEEVYLKAYEIIESFYDEEDRIEIDLEKMYESSAYSTSKTAKCI